MITVVSDVSRRAPESIGEAFKTMFARYQDILQGGVDEEGMGINNVGKALERVGINIRDAEGGFRDFSDVLDELYPKWDKINEVEQANILKSLAGTRQRESLLILLENQEKYEKGLEIQLNSTGKALERYDEYLSSVEAAQNRFNASWEKLAMGTTTSEMISNFYDAGAGVLDFIDSIGGIPRILEIVIPLIIIFNSELIKTNALSAWSGLTSFGLKMVTFGKDLGAAISLMKAGTSATNALNLAFGTTAVTMAAVTAGLASIIAVIYTYNEQVVKTQKAGLENTANEWTKIFDNVKKDGGDATDVLKKYQEGIEAINKAHAEGGVVADLFVNKEKMIVSGLGETVVALGETSSSYDEYIKKVKEAASLAGYQADEGGIYKSTRYGKEYIEGIAVESAQTFNDTINKKLAEQEIQLFGDPESIISQGTKAGELAYTGLSETIKSLADSTTDDLIEKSIKGELDFEDIPKIPEEYLSALDVVNGKLRLNIDTVKELQLAEAEAAVQSAINAGAKQSEIDVLQLYYEQLLAESQETFGQFNQTAWAYDELLWKISNDAFTAGYSFTDMEGKALTSAQAIFDYMAKGDAQFNSVIAQIAQQTGLSVVEVMNMVNAEIDRTAARAASVMGGLGAGFMGAPFIPVSTPAPPMFPTPSIPAPSTGGGGSGGSGSDEYEKQREEAERLREVEREIEEARKKAIDALKKQLSLYKQMIDKKKDLLDAEKKERDYQQDLEEQQNNIAKIQSQIAELSLDDSEEAKAQVLALQEQLAKAQKDLENTEYDHSIEEQKEALDKEYARVEKIINRALEAISKINASSLDSFSEQLAKILAKISKKIPEFHTGGVVGGVYQNKENEQFATLLKKEVVVTPEQMSGFMNKTLPNLMAGSPNIKANEGGISVGNLMSFVVNGNLDKTVIPSIETIANKVVEKLNNNMLMRGTKRNAGLFSS